MAFTGLKKQWNKTNQRFCERMGSAEQTKASDEFVEMERQTDLTCHVLDEVVDKTKEMLYPNPTIRAKLAISSNYKGVSKYPHPEGKLADQLIKYGNLVGKEVSFGQSLVQVGCTMKEATAAKYGLEESVKKNVLEPFTQLQKKDLKDCLYHRRKLKSRRLDYDCRKRKVKKGVNIAEAEVTSAQNKYEESLRMATVAMQTLIESNNNKQISHLADLSEAIYQYHNQCADIFRTLTAKLRRQSEPKTKSDVTTVWSTATDAAVNAVNSAVEPLKGVSGIIGLNGQLKSKSIYNITSPSVSTHYLSLNAWKSQSADELRSERPCAKAIYDFTPEHENELQFNEGDVLELIERVDDNWFDAILDGREGLIPVNFVEVLVPLPR